MTAGTGNGCHRALRSYPKLVAGYMAADYDVTLVDVTCSGAKIQRGGKPPLIGDVAGGVIEADSQVSNALSRLASAGLTAGDVDVVTVGMGGNDAKFAPLIKACLAPTLARQLVTAYDQTPGLVSWAVNRLSCERLDKYVFRASEAIDGLAAQERFAQRQLRAAFPQADIFQADYPGLLPDPDAAPTWCGGIGSGDIEYANTQALRINDVIRDTVATANEENAAMDRYYQLVEVEGAFGSNALCPTDPSEALANGIDKENFDLEVQRLLSDSVLGPRLDEVSKTYRSLRNCLIRLTVMCDPKARTDPFNAAMQALVDQIGTDEAFLNTVLANIAKPPSSGESVGVRLDRAPGLFHPNLAGTDVLSCYVYGTITFRGTGECPNGGAPSLTARQQGDSQMLSSASADLNELTATLTPIDVEGPGTQNVLNLPGYAPGSRVR